MSERAANHPRLADIDVLELEHRPRRPARPLNFQVVDWEAEKRASHALLHSDAAVWLAAKAITVLLLARFAVRLVEGPTQSPLGRGIDLLTAPLVGPLGSEAFGPLVALGAWLVLALVASRVVRTLRS